MAENAWQLKYSVKSTLNFFLAEMMNGRQNHEKWVVDTQAMLCIYYDLKRDGMVDTRANLSTIR